MQNALKLQKNLEYARFIHLSTMYIIALMLFLFTKIPHNWWILLTMLVVSAVLEPGLVVKRAILRIKGTLLALILLIPLLYVLQLNYRLIPIVFIMAAVGMGVSALNVKRYDISVFFITIVIFLLTAQTVMRVTPEGPFEMVLNRAVCTIMGITIVLVGDYFLFNSYQYEKKLYNFHQILLYDFLKKIALEIKNTNPEQVNALLFTEKLRDRFTTVYARIAVSSESIQVNLKHDHVLNQIVTSYQDIIWELRRVIFAMCYAKFNLRAEEAFQLQWQRCQLLLQLARENMCKN